MKLNHKDHYENMLIYGNCECGSGLTISDLVKETERKKLEKILSNYPDIRLGKKIDELSASIPF